MNQVISLEYWRLDKCEELRWDLNSKLHDVGALSRSIERYGFRDALEFDSTLGRFVAGHGRIETLRALQRRGPMEYTKHWPPQYLKEDPIDSEWMVPVQVGCAADSIASAEAYALDNNALVMQGGDFNPMEISRMHNQLGYASVLIKLHEQKELPETVDENDLQYFLSRLAKESAPKEDRDEPDSSGGLEYFLQFETVNQKQKFLDFLDYLRHEYPEDDSHVGRLIRHIEMVI